MLEELIAIVGHDRVHTDEPFREAYSYDAFLRSARPDVVVRPAHASQIAPIVRAAARAGAPLVARGAGTGYCGGAVPLHGGLALVLNQLRAITIDAEAGLAVVEPGVITGDLQREARAHGWRWVPDPSSYSVCTIGGNIATNAGGSHCLAHGTTTQYVEWIDLVLSDGEEVRLDRRDALEGGLDLRAIVIGSEGTLGVVARAGLRLVRPPEAVGTVFVHFADDERAIAFLIDCFDAGLVPAAMDLNAGPLLPDGGQLRAEGDALFFIDLEGAREEVAEMARELHRLAERHGGRPELIDSGTLAVRRLGLTIESWRRITARTGATRYFLFDAGVPRSRLAESLQLIRATAKKHAMPVGNSFHAGDGNIHPTIFFRTLDGAALDRIMGLWREILCGVATLGGTISGEHGVGLEKIDYMQLYYSRQQLDVMRALQRAFDPGALCNPGKLIPPKRDSERAEACAPADDAIEVSERDGLVWAPASTSFAALEAALADRAYELAWWPLGGGELTVGEALLTGVANLRETRVPARDSVLAVRLVASDGTTLTLGSRIGKDVGGYELRKLCFGSRGRLGAPTHVCLRLLPRAAECVDYAVGVATPAAALALEARLRSTVSTSAIELAGGGARVRLRLEHWRGSVARRCDALEAQLAAAGLEWLRSDGAPLSRWSPRRLQTRSLASTGDALPLLDLLTAQRANALHSPGAGMLAHDGTLPAASPPARPERLRSIEAAIVHAFARGAQ
jgi:glycolate oxidase